MIMRVGANVREFKEVKFERGLNVVLAERTQDASDKDSRNGLGKSTLIDVIHFCLASRPGPNDALRRTSLSEWTFEMTLSLRGKQVEVRRAPRDPNRIWIDGADVSWPIGPRQDSATGDSYFTREQWALVLGWAMFDLAPETALEPYSPTFRSLISYFARSGPGAYLNPFQQFPAQKEWTGK